MQIDYNYYEELIKPKFFPSKEVFKNVWAVLYGIMFVSLYIFMNTKTSNSRIVGFILFLIQLGLNIIWVPVFFGYRKIFSALIICTILSIFVFFTILAFCKVSILAGVMNIPYLLWTIFACFLNYKIWEYNK